MYQQVEEGVINWNDDIPIDKMKMILLLAGYVKTETDRSIEFTLDNSLIRVEKHFSPHHNHRAFCRIIVGDRVHDDVGTRTFDSRKEALEWLELI